MHTRWPYRRNFYRRCCLVTANTGYSWPLSVVLRVSANDTRIVGACLYGMPYTVYRAVFTCGNGVVFRSEEPLL